MDGDFVEPGDAGERAAVFFPLLDYAFAVSRAEVQSAQVNFVPG